MNFENFTTEQLINAMPENRPLYKDSGLWTVRSDDMEDIIYPQGTNQTFREFVIGYLTLAMNVFKDDAEYIRTQLL